MPLRHAGPAGNFVGAAGGAAPVTHYSLPMNRLLLLAFALPMLPAAAQPTLTNSGASLTVQAGAVLYVAGSVQNNGPLANAGTVQLTGDLTNTSSLGGTGLLRFSGSQDQTLASPAGTTLSNLEVANSGSAGNNRLLVPNNLTLTSLLTLSSGLVRTAASATITLPAGATLSGEATGRYVQGNLKVLRTAAGGTVDFGLGVVLDATGQSLGSVSVTRTAGLATADVSYGTNLNSTTQGIDRIWTIVPGSQPTAPVPVTFAWLPDDDHGLSSFSQTQLWQQPATGSPWATAGVPGNASSRSLTRSVAAFNRFTISNGANPLPVTLVSFTAERQGADGLLLWATASELNTAYFAVESSADGRTFGPLGQVAGHGTTTQPQHYQFLDLNLARYAADVVYYRLRQVDLDGTETFSPVRTVRPAAEASPWVQAFPNPFGAHLALRLRLPTAGPAGLTLTDAVGRTIWARQAALPAGSSEVALDELSQLPQGLYVLTVQAAGWQQQVKVVRE